MELLHGADRHVVITRHQRRKPFTARKQFGNRRRAAGGVPLSLRNQPLAQRNTVLRQRVLVAGETLNPGGGIQRAGDKRDLPVPFRNQLRHRLLTGGFMI